MYISMIEKSWPHWSCMVRKKDRENPSRISMIEKSWPHWSYIGQMNNTILISSFPWLKNHGHIEAWSTSNAICTSSTLFPWLKNHGHIEAFCFLYIFLVFLEFPWLKNHGHIEASSSWRHLFHLIIISMIKKSWPHWSISYRIGHGDSISISMIEKSWPHWSLNGTILTMAIPDIFPWLKNHGHIEAILRSGCPFLCSSSFPWLKNHGHIEADHPTFVPLFHFRFPWLKNHGYIRGAKTHQQKGNSSWLKCILD